MSYPLCHKKNENRSQASSEHFRVHLARIQAALKQQDYTKMSPEFLLQMNFQLQTRLDTIRQQVPLRTPQISMPLQALPPIG